MPSLNPTLQPVWETAVQLYTICFDSIFTSIEQLSLQYGTIQKLCGKLRMNVIDGVAVWGKYVIYEMFSDFLIIIFHICLVKWSFVRRPLVLPIVTDWHEGAHPNRNLTVEDMSVWSGSISWFDWLIDWLKSLFCIEHHNNDFLNGFDGICCWVRSQEGAFVVGLCKLVRLLIHMHM